MIDAVLACLRDGGAESLVDSEIERCMKGRAAEGALTIYAKEFRDAGDITITQDQNSDLRSKSDCSDWLAVCAQCGADPAQYCKAGWNRGREPHDQDSAWMNCERCGNSITVVGKHAAQRVRRCWNISAN